MNYYIDEISADCVTGWAVSAKGIHSVVISVDGREVGTARTGLSRPDIRSSFPDLTGSGEAGFFFPFRREHFDKSVSSIAVDIVESDGSRSSARSDRVPTVFEESRGR